MYNRIMNSALKVKAAFDSGKVVKAPGMHDLIDDVIANCKDLKHSKAALENNREWSTILMGLQEILRLSLTRQKKKNQDIFSFPPRSQALSHSGALSSSSSTSSSGASSSTSSTSSRSTSSPPNTFSELSPKKQVTTSCHAAHLLKEIKSKPGLFDEDVRRHRIAKLKQN